MKVYIKNWFLSKISSENYGLHFFNEACEILKETAKAYLLSVSYSTLDGEYDGFKEVWCPKSCTMSIDEFNENETQIQNRFEKGCDEYQKLIDFAKQNGVKGVRVGLKKQTIIQKIKQAGLAY